MNTPDDFDSQNNGSFSPNDAAAANEREDAAPRIVRPDAPADPAAGSESPVENEPAVKMTKNIRKQRKKHPILRTLLILFLLFLITLSVGGYFAYREAWNYYLSSTTVSTAAPPSVVLYDTAVPEKDFRIESGSLLLSCEFVKANLDPAIYWETDTGKVVVTTADQVIEMDTGALTAYVNAKPVELDVPVTLYDGIPFIPIDFFTSIYGYEVTTTEADIVVIDDLKKPILSMTVKPVDIMPELAFLKNIRYLGTLSYLQDVPYLRETASFQSPRIRELSPGDSVVVVGEENNWYKVRCADGVFGFLKKSQLELREIIPERVKKTVYETPWPFPGEFINLTWEYLSAARYDMSGYKDMPGVNVISPTFFSLKDTEGNIKNIASTAYVDWAHKQGMQVWALCSNGFDPDMTSPFLHSYELRKKFIRQLLVFAETYRLDGINLDFENVYLADKDYLTQFVREMVPYMHAEGLTVSMDVTIRSKSETWSMCYDREALAKVVDYMAVMTYDEHTKGSKEAGSVASLPWVENGVVRILEQVPAEKLVLGVPFYTRLWKEESGTDSSVTLTSEALTMVNAQKWLVKRNVVTVADEATGQNYGEYTSGSTIWKIWMEDEYSMRKRVDLIHKYHLAGVASWSMYFADDAIWGVITDELAKAP